MGVRYLLDTNICIYIIKHNPPAVRERFAQHAANELAMSVVTLGELRFGAEKSRSRAKAIESIRRLEKVLQIAPMPTVAGEHYGEIRAVLQKKGQIIGNNDLWLAAHARAEGWILVTNNMREFSRVPQLKIENWVNR
jgi:tRNA(fMet)-specific endonuclease VapC